MMKTSKFPWDKCARLGIEDFSLPLKDITIGEEDQQSYQGNDQEGITMDEHSKGSLPNTPSMNICDPQLIEEIPRINLEACSKNSEKVMTPLEENQIPNEDSS